MTHHLCKWKGKVVSINHELGLINMANTWQKYHKEKQKLKALS